MIKSFRDLIVWQRAMDLTHATYVATRRFPRNETYGLTSQMRRSAVSVPSNIAEGHMRSTAEFLRFISIALGSLAEYETQLLVAQRFQYLEEKVCVDLLQTAHEVGRMLRGLQAKL